MERLKFLPVVVLLFVIVGSSYGEKILFLLPLASRSHVHVFEPLIKALGEKGHEIVNLSPMESPNMPPTVRQIQLITVEDLIGNMPNPFEQRKAGLLAQMMNKSSVDHMHKACIKALESPKLHNLLMEKFDLVIVDIFLNHCVLGVIPHFKAHSIIVSTSTVPSSIATSVGNRLPPSFVPSMMLKLSDRMSLYERLSNTVFDTVLSFMWDWLIIRDAEKMYRDHLPNGTLLPGIDEIMADTSMVFTNSHFTLSYPRPMLPDVVEVGGMHTRPPKKLPKDLDEFLSGSGEEGFIFFSLGSIVKPHEMPDSYRKVFVNVFSRLKQRVIWKWNGTMVDLPPNVKLSKWLPQQDILGHPNIRVFMTHGGLLSTQESVYHGVPVLGLPIFGDQDLNIQQAELRGYAKFVEIVDITEEQLETALLELLNNPTYRQNVKELSNLVKDLPQSPLEKAVYWTEYILRHKGAKHFRSAARDLNFIQYYLLDVTAIIIGIVCVTLYLAVSCCRCTWRRACRSKSSIKKQHLKKA